MSTSRRRPREEGMIAVEFVAALGFLLLPVTILVLNLPTWAERQSVARVAAREVARTYVLTGDKDRSAAVLDEIADNYKIDRSDMTMSDLGSKPEPGDEVTVHVHIQVPVVNLGVLGINNAAFQLDEVHTEDVDQYRSSSS